MHCSGPRGWSRPCVKERPWRAMVSHREGPRRSSLTSSRRAVAEPVGILGQIAAAKREELARRFDGVTLDALRSRARPTRRSLAAALTQPGARFILEIKKASPSE